MTNRKPVGLVHVQFNNAYFLLFFLYQAFVHVFFIFFVLYTFLLTPTFTCSFLWDLCDSFHDLFRSQNFLRRTTVDYRTVVHDNQPICSRQEVGMVGAKYSGFILQKPHDAVLKEVRSYVGIYSREGVIKKINLFILSTKTSRIFSTQVTTMQAEPSEIQRSTNNEQTRPGLKQQWFNKSGKMVCKQKFPNLMSFCPTI